MTYATTTFFKPALSLALLLAASKLAVAETPQIKHKSIGGVAQSFGERQQALAELKLQPLTSQSMTQTRQQRIASRQKQLNPTSGQAAIAHSFYNEFSFFDVGSFLFDDLDYDGFYHSFSVSFDADVYNPNGAAVADVYAELYLSRNGGPWEHYYSTDIFTLYGSTTEDRFEVLTSLEQGYGTDHYDVLIDLYEVGYSDIVATISSFDSNSLYALPLESYDYDDPDYEEHHHHSGSLPLWGLLAILGLVGYRRKSRS